MSAFASKTAYLIMETVLDVFLLSFVFLITLADRIFVNPVNFIIRIIRDSYISENNLNKFYDGKVVLITGCSSGIGEALVKVLASSSDCAMIILAGRDINKINHDIVHYQSIKPSTRFISWDIDLLNYMDIETKYREMKKQLTIAPIDILINNAGVSSRGSALETDLNSLQKVMSVNFYGTVALTREVARDMVSSSSSKASSSHIAVVSSVQGKVGIPQRSSYSSSKHAIQGFFDSLRAELSCHSIFTTVISPAYVNTQLSLNAVTTDGSAYGTTDLTTATGMDARDVAIRILIAIANKEVDVVITDIKTIKIKAAVYVRNLLPALLSMLTRSPSKRP